MFHINAGNLASNTKPGVCDQLSTNGVAPLFTRTDSEITKASSVISTP